MMSTRTVSRARNPRGGGLRLREEIVEAARAILAEEGHETAVTLRGVARRVGIAAPSIYAHFSDTDAIVQAAVVATFREFGERIVTATDGLVDPVQRLLAGCHAYLTYGIENPNSYKLLFDRNRELGGHSPEGQEVVEDDLVTGPFGILVGGVQDCMNAGVSTARSASSAALEIWIAMHGLVSLRGAQYQMPWPPRQIMEPSLILALARISS